MCSFLQGRRFLVLCMSVNHLLGLHSLKPVLSTNRWIATPVGLCSDKATVRAHRPVAGRSMPTSLSVWCSVNRNIARNISAAVIARFDTQS